MPAIYFWIFNTRYCLTTNFQKILNATCNKVKLAKKKEGKKRTKNIQDKNEKKDMHTIQAG